MDQHEEFVKLYGKIGEIYYEPDWMLRFGFFCTGFAAGWDAALKEQGAAALQSGEAPSHQLKPKMPPRRRAANIVNVAAEKHRKQVYENNVRLI